MKMHHNSLLIRFPEGREKAVTLSYDDGVEEDLRLADILQTYGLKGTFNVNSDLFRPEGFIYPLAKAFGRKLTKEKIQELFSRPGIEPAIHGYTHAITNTLPEGPMAYEILKDREALERLFGKPIRGMAYPNNAYSDRVTAVLKACNIIYARTTDSTETFSIPLDWYRWDPTCQHISKNLKKLTDTFLNTTPTKHQDAFLFYLWGHSYEFARDENWNVIESFAASLGGQDEIWYATNTEIYEYVESFRHLIFDLNLTNVKNPTAIPVWFMLREKLRKVNPGEILALD